MSPRWTVAYGILVMAALSLADSSDAARVPVTFRTIAFTGEPAPGTGTTFSTFDEAVINNAEDVAFLATAGTSRRGVWKKPRHGPVELVALQDDPLPGLTGATFNQFNEVNINEKGTVAFITSLFGLDGQQNEAIVAQDGAGGLRIVARKGDQAPLDGEPGPRFLTRPRLTPVSDQRGFLLNDRDEMAFHSSTVSQEGLASGTGVFREVGGLLETAVISVYPGTSPAPIQTVSENPTFNGVGEVATVVNGDAGARVLPGGPGQDEEAPGTGGALFQSFKGPVINAAGELAFAAFLKNPPGDSTLVGGNNSSAIYTTAGGSLTLVARAGSVAPDSGFAFATLSSVPVFLNDRGDVVFEAGLVGAPNDANIGLWAMNAGGSLRKVFVEGESAPDAPGFQLALGGGVTPSQNLVANASGHIAFLAIMRSISGGPQQIGLFIELGGQLRLVVKTGDRFELAPGDFRTIANTSGLGIQLFGGTGNADGRRSGYNDQDQTVVRLEFGSQGGQAVILLDDFLLSAAAADSKPRWQLIPNGVPLIEFSAVPGVLYSVQTSTDLSQPGGGLLEVGTVPPPSSIPERVLIPLPELQDGPRAFLRLELRRAQPGP